MFQLLPFWKIDQIVLQKQSSWFLTFLVVVACCTTDLALRGMGLFLKNNPVSVSIEHCRITECNKKWWHLPVTLVPEHPT